MNRFVWFIITSLSYMAVLTLFTRFAQELTPTGTWYFVGGLCVCNVLGFVEGTLRK